jgi:hypothetical protein
MTTPTPAPAPLPPQPMPVPLRSPTEEIKRYRPQPGEYKFLEEFTENEQ